MIKIEFDAAGAELLKLLEGLPKRIDQALEAAVQREAEFLRAKLIEGIDSQSPGGKKFHPHSPLTLAIRRATKFRGTKILIRTASLRNSMAVVRLSNGTVFVGIRRGAPSKGKLDVVNVARIQQEGATIPITDKMRRFLFAMLRKSGMQLPRDHGSKRGVIVIPARPFIQPVLQQWAQPEQVKKRFAEAFTELLGGDLGTP